MATGSARPLKMTELKELSSLEISNRLKEWEDNLEAIRFQHDSGQLPNTAKVRQIRRDISRIKTVMREVELGLRKPKGATA